MKREHSLHFQFDGKTYYGFEGDTLASALLANDVTIIGRSFKYHRPRGIFSAGSEEPNALVEIHTGPKREPNSRATTIELFAGLEARSQNCFPSLQFDVLSLNRLFAPVLAAGFYYKTFMWPASWWEKYYEPAIRRAAGLGQASGKDDPDSYEKVHAFCDALIVGGGPAGLMAALSAARSGLRVILCDEDFAFGGRLLAENHAVDGQRAIDWAANIVNELTSRSNVKVLARTTLLSAYDGKTFVALERVCDHLPASLPHRPRQRLWKIVAQNVVIATGSYERLMAFEGNDKPGVMQASAIRSYVNRFAVAPGKTACFFTATDGGWQAALDIAHAGVNVAAIVDPRDNVDPTLVERIKKRGASVFKKSEVMRALGSPRIKAIEVATQGRTVATVACDVLGLSGGFNPSVSVASHLGMRPRWSESVEGFVADDLPPGMFLAGAARGINSLAGCIADGIRAGISIGGKSLPVPASSDDACAIGQYWCTHRNWGKAFVDLQNDVTVSDIELAVREGFANSEHLKRYTTLGMATDQGKTGALVGQMIMASLVGIEPSKVSPPVSRPPSVPVAIGAYAGFHRGKHFRPTRLTAGHDWSIERNATFTEAGQWLRAQWFARPEEKDWLETVTREATAVRAAVGVCDVSTLGKIDIQGPDAGVFLDRIYINTFSTLPVGKARYGVMLREDGFVMDDGTTSRLAPDHYFMTTTTANAAKVMEHLEFCHQALWPALDVQMVSVTEQWSQYAIAGPRSREVLQKLIDRRFDISNAAFPFLAAGSIRLVGGVDARLFRISFSGELAYELAVPARYGDAVIREIMKAGAEFDIMPYGTEALSVLRIEKGHAAGNELNGQTTARDLGLDKMMSKKKDYIGRVLSQRPALVAENRPRLTGLRPLDSKRRLRGGAQLLAPNMAVAPENVQGHVTSVCFSPTVGQWIGLGLLQHGQERIGEHVRALDPVRGQDFLVEVCAPVFVDPEGKRLHV